MEPWEITKPQSVVLHQSKMMVARRKEGDVERFIDWLAKNDVSLTDAQIATLRAYLVQLVSDYQRGDAARPAPACNPRQLMDDHVLIAGLSELCFKENVMALGCNSPMQFQYSYLPEEWKKLYSAVGRTNPTV